MVVGGDGEGDCDGDFGGGDGDHNVGGGDGDGDGDGDGNHDVDGGHGSESVVVGGENAQTTFPHTSVMFYSCQTTTAFYNNICAVNIFNSCYNIFFPNTYFNNIYLQINVKFHFRTHR